MTGFKILVFLAIIVSSTLKAQETTYKAVQVNAVVLTRIDSGTLINNESDKGILLNEISNFQVEEVQARKYEDRHTIHPPMKGKTRSEFKKYLINKEVKKSNSVNQHDS